MQECTGINRPSTTQNTPNCVQRMYFGLKKKQTRGNWVFRVEREWLGHKACSYKNIEYNRDQKGWEAIPFFWHKRQCSQWREALQLPYFLSLTQVSEGRHPAKLYVSTAASRSLLEEQTWRLQLSPASPNEHWSVPVCSHPPLAPLSPGCSVLC